MPSPFDRVFLGDVVTAGQVLRHGWVALRGETVAALGQGEPPPAHDVADHAGCLILPGLVDGHMHTASSIGWPGIEGATRSAAAGGVTTCVDMPYDVPHAVTTAALLADKIGWVERTAHVDMALYGTIAKHGGVDAIAGLAEAGVSAFKLSTYEYDAVRFPRIDHPTMLAAFRRDRQDRPARRGIHNEDQELVLRLTADAQAPPGRTRSDHACPHPPAAGREHGRPRDLRDGAGNRLPTCTSRIASIARGFDMAAACSASMEGAKTSGEACIQYLCMTEEDLVRLEGFGKCNPPFRTAAEVERVWQRLLAGQGRLCLDRPRALAARSGRSYARRHLRSRGAGLTGLQSFAPLDVHPAGRARPAADPDGAPTAPSGRPEVPRTVPARRAPSAIGADCRPAWCWNAARFTFDEADDPGPARDARWSPYHGRADAGPRRRHLCSADGCIWDGTSRCTPEAGDRPLRPAPAPRHLSRGRLSHVPYPAHRRRPDGAQPARRRPRAASWRRMLALLEQCGGGRGAQLVVFPELAFTTFFPRWPMDRDSPELDSPASRRRCRTRKGAAAVRPGARARRRASTWAMPS